MQTIDKYEHAEANAKAWFEELRDHYRAYLENPEYDEERDRLLDEMPLSVECRASWHTVGDKTGDTEYRILLTTGGPALQVWGELNGYGEPENAVLQMQDWGVPWREVWPCEVAEMDKARDALLWFASRHYFGE